MAVDVRRAGSRFRTRLEWLDSHHSFSFGPHYDPANTSHGLLLANNHDVVRAGAGFDPHPHRDVEILTWVLQGSLVHQDSAGHSGVISPGTVQRMSAGSGVLHAERNGSPDVPVSLVQMWVAPDRSGGDPFYEQREIDLPAGSLVPVASGLRHVRAAVGLGSSAALHDARLTAGHCVTLPDAPWLHLYVAAGAVSLEGAGALAVGDAVRLNGGGGHAVTATEPAEVLVWEMHAGL